MVIYDCNKAQTCTFRVHKAFSSNYLLKPGLWIRLGLTRNRSFTARETNGWIRIQSSKICSKISIKNLCKALDPTKNQDPDP